MKYYQYLGLISILIFSFFYAEKIANITLENNEIFQSINNYKDKYTIKPVNAIITDNYMIPGLNGKEVNIKKSYHKMKKYDSYNPNYIIYNSIIPTNSIKNNLDKVINKGNSLKKEVAIIVKDNNKVINYLLNKGVEVTILVNSSNYSDYKAGELINNDAENYRRMENILNNNKQNTNICYINNIIENICRKYKKYLVKTNLIVDNQSFINIKNNISNGDIYYISNNLNIDYLQIFIKTIEYRDLKIVYLSKLISEERY